IEAAQQNHPIVVVADPQECSFQFDPVGGARFTTSCDVAKSALAGMRVAYANETAAPGTIAQVLVGDRTIATFDGTKLSAADFKQRNAAFKEELTGVIKAAGYPSMADPAQI